MTRMWIVLGDRTSSGGQVVTGSPFTDIDGKPVARVTDQATCLKHQGTFPIVDGDPTTIIDGQPVALHGSKLACGCTVMAVEQVRVFLASAASASASPVATAASAAGIHGAAANAAPGEAQHPSHVHAGDGGDHVVDAAKARDVVRASNDALEAAGAYRPYATEEAAAKAWAEVVLPVANAPEHGVEVGAVITRKDGKYLLGSAYSTGSEGSCDGLPELGPRRGGEMTGYIHTHPERYGFVGRDRAFRHDEFPEGIHNIGGKLKGSDIQSGDLVVAYGGQWNAYIAEPGHLIGWNYQRYVELQKKARYDLSPDAEYVRLGAAEESL